jgi:nitrite reductase (NADH) small subunit
MADTAMAASMVRRGIWVSVCRADQLRVDVGVAALVGGEQVALFRLDAEQIRAIGNLDPYSGAQVLSRGIVGSRAEAVFVASPMYKQPFDLRTGQCLDDPAVSVSTFEVRVVDGVVQVLAPPTGQSGVAEGQHGAADGQYGADQGQYGTTGPVAR